jgi:hypothetical protein
MVDPQNMIFQNEEKWAYENQAKVKMMAIDPQKIFALQKNSKSVLALREP